MKKMPDKCKCASPILYGRRIDFMASKEGEIVKATDFKIKCRACNKFHSYMSKINFNMSKVPTYEELLG